MIDYNRGVLENFVDCKLRFTWESLAPEVCAMPLEEFAVEPTADEPYKDNTSHRQYRKAKWIRNHIEGAYLVDLDDFMVRFGGYEDGTPMMATLAPHELVDFGAAVVRHHGDSLLEKAADDFYFTKETRVPRVAWRFVYTGKMNDPGDDEEDLSEMEQYI